METPEKAQHTPGPWIVNPFCARVDCAALDEWGDPIPILELLWPTDYRTEAETEANARLIAAAPELLELAYQYISDLRYPPSEESRQRRIQRAKQVIAKATVSPMTRAESLCATPTKGA